MSISILSGPIKKSSSVWMRESKLSNSHYTALYLMILQHIYILMLGCYNVLLGYYDALLQHRWISVWFYTEYFNKWVNAYLCVQFNA